MGEEGTSEEAGKGEVWLVCGGCAGCGPVELADGGRAIEEGKDASVGGEDIGVMEEGHV